VPNLDTVKEEEVLQQLTERIGKKFEELRKKKGYSSYESFAFDHNLPRMQYWRIENGKTNITLKSLVRLLAIHKMTVEEFFSTLVKEAKPGKRTSKD
jgi:transcriptional regulator with XRE-family HTH domain